MRAMALQSFSLVVLFAALGCSGGSSSGGDSSQEGGTPNTNRNSNVGARGGSSSTGKSASDHTHSGSGFGGSQATGVGASTNGSNASGGKSGRNTASEATGGNTENSKAAGGSGAIGGKSGSKASGGATMGGKPAGGATSGGAPNGGTSGGAGAPNGECAPPTEYPNLFVTLSGHTQEESDKKVADAWSKLFNPKGSGNIYFDGPGTDESYVKDIASGDVRTEGMSYGMMAAVQLDHQTEFDRLWKWVKTHMANGTGEISWSCSSSGTMNYSGGAPDGEEYMATALIFAHHRWGDSSGKYDYATEAQWVLDLIRTKYFDTTHHLVKFLSNANNTDASYILPAFYRVWACFDTAHADFWKEAVKAGREFFHIAIDGNGVIPDQSSFTGGTVKGAGPDTMRCVMNIMMDANFFNADPWQKDTYAKKYGAYMKTQNPYTSQMSCNSLLGFGLPAADGKGFVDKIWAASVPSGNYWDGVLYMLGMLHVSGTFKLWY